jgi:deoxyribodipyrimidine photolyase-related protein
MTAEKIKEKSDINCAFLIYPNQLFEDCSLIGSNATIFLIEEPIMFTQYRFHKQKILFHRASMRAYQSYLESKGYNVNYVEYSEIKKTQDIISLLKKDNITKVFMYDPVDNWLHQRLAKVFSKNTIDFIIHDTPLFLCIKKELDSFFIPIIEKNKKMIMATFYT